MSFKSDDYQKSRGGYSQTLNLGCNRCGLPLGSYQKDGPGPLKRLYIDRLTAIEPSQSYAENAVLFCFGCKRPLALGYIYAKENRPSWTLFAHTLKATPSNYKTALTCWVRGLFL